MFAGATPTRLVVLSAEEAQRQQRSARLDRQKALSEFRRVTRQRLRSVPPAPQPAKPRISAATRGLLATQPVDPARLLQRQGLIARLLACSAGADPPRLRP